MSYTRAQFEADLAELEGKRSLVRQGLIAKFINGLEAKRIFDNLDQQERRLNGKLLGTRLAMQSGEMERKAGWITAIPSLNPKRPWVRPMGGRWITTSPKELTELQGQGHQICLSVVWQQKNQFEPYRKLGWIIKIREPKERDEQDAQPKTVEPEIKQVQRHYQVVEAEIAQELAAWDKFRMSQAKLKGFVPPQCTEIVWGFNGDLTKAALVVWQ